MYHGAEHKCINCIEHGLPLTVENVRVSSKEHKRCGTSFLMFCYDRGHCVVVLCKDRVPHSACGDPDRAPTDHCRDLL